MRLELKKLRVSELTRYLYGMVLILELAGLALLIVLGEESAIDIVTQAVNDKQVHFLDTRRTV